MKKSMYFLLAVLFHFQLACSKKNETSQPQNTPQPVQEEKKETQLLQPEEIPSHEYQILPTENGRAMAYQFKPGSKSTVWLFIHGLADDMQKMSALSDLASQDGHPVLKVDLQGHGATFKEYLKSHSSAPEKLPYEDNITDIAFILNHLQIKDLVIVGHSYGGGIAFGLAAELNQKKDVQVRSLHMLAPYVQRIDKFIRESYGYGVAGQWTPQNSTATPEEIQDEMWDPLLQKFMEKTYRTYILENYEGKLTEAQEKEVELKVQAAILTTKGIRPFDLLDESKPFPKIGAPLQVLGGRRDQLVLPAQIYAFEKRLMKEKVPYERDFLKGLKATHLFPRQMPQETYQLITEFQKKELNGSKE